MSTTRNGTSAPYELNDSPYYLFDLDGFRSNITELCTAVRRHYQNFELAYSFKTNYLRAACEAVKEAGGYAEVVSPYEYAYAKMLGFDGSKIVYNGVIPSFGKVHALAAGGMVNIDSFAEYEQLENFVELFHTPMKVGVRVNLKVADSRSRFGIPPESEEFQAIMRRIDDHPLMSLGGFHNHLHGRRWVRHWLQRASVMVDLVKRYGGEYIDLGGGMWGKMPDSLYRQFSDRPNTYQEYGDAIGDLFAGAFPGGEVRLLFEPGIGLVGSTMECVSHVVGIKSIRGKQYAGRYGRLTERSPK